MLLLLLFLKLSEVIKLLLLLYEQVLNFLKVAGLFISLHLLPVSWLLRRKDVIAWVRGPH